MTLKSVLILVAFLAVVYNLGAAAFYMVTNQSASGRTARALTWRIGLSVALIVLVMLGIASGLIEPHGLRGGQ